MQKLVLVPVLVAASLAPIASAYATAGPDFSCFDGAHKLDALATAASYAGAPVCVVRGAELGVSFCMSLECSVVAMIVEIVDTAAPVAPGPSTPTGVRVAPLNHVELLA